jgi:hypothetical protein
MRLFWSFWSPIYGRYRLDADFFNRLAVRAKFAEKRLLGTRVDKGNGNDLRTL